jgi:hypothetical protein
MFVQAARDAHTRAQRGALMNIAFNASIDVTNNKKTIDAFFI